MRRLLWLLALAACSRAPEPEARPVEARFVRVYLRSLGDWKQLSISAKGGVQIDGEQRDAFVLRRDEPRTIRIRPTSGVLTIGTRAYAGELYWRPGTLVNIVSLENYVLGVLRGELPLEKVPVAAAAAQAIAVRSYALHYVEQHKKKFDVDDTTHFQVYAGLRDAPDDDALREGAQATTGLYLEYLGKPLKAYYHSTCGGHTTDLPTGLDRAAQKPMSGVECDFCKASKYYRWKARLSDAEILKAAGLKGPLRSFCVDRRGPGQRASLLRIETDSIHLVTAGTFRLAVGPSKLRSVRILRISRQKGGYLVEGGGWGHGVGLCQMGAIGLGDKNWSAKRIASYYYPGAVLGRIQ